MSAPSRAEPSPAELEPGHRHAPPGPRHPCPPPRRSCPRGLATPRPAPPRAVRPMGAELICIFAYWRGHKGRGGSGGAAGCPAGQWECLRYSCGFLKGADTTLAFWFVCFPLKLSCCGNVRGERRRDGEEGAPGCRLPLPAVGGCSRCRSGWRRR